MYFAWNHRGPSAGRRLRGGVARLTGVCALVMLCLAACAKSDHGWNNAGARPGDGDKIGGNEPPGTIADPGVGGPSGEAPGGCADVDKSYAPKIEASGFIEGVDNPYFPLVVGATAKYAGEKRTSEAKVTPNTKKILGVPTVEVRESISTGGKVTADSASWYAQDKEGAVWLLGRSVRQLDGTKVLGTEGSWEAGKDGAQPGVVMPAETSVGAEWRQAYYPCHLDEVVSVLADNASINTTGGSFTGCIQTHETTPLDPSVDVEKYYCKDKGLVLRDDKAAGNREGLTEYKTPQPSPFPPPGGGFPPPGGGFDFPDAGGVGLPEMPPLPPLGPPATE